jgi:type I restriction enzyme M protein
MKGNFHVRFGERGGETRWLKGQKMRSAPTLRSGSLLLKVGDEAGTPVTLYGQEKDAATSSLARMNMILHNNPTALIMQGNTLTDPKFKDGDTLKTFDFVVANPPFSDKRWSTGLDPLNDPYERFKSFGTPPGKQGDYAYLLHIVRTLKSTGKGACILPHGVLFRGNAEADIRRALVRKGYIKGIIGLPANLFYGTGIPACIVVIDKEDAHARKGIFMIDASAGFMKDGPKNRLRAQDIHKIVDVFNKRLEVDKYARMVSFEEIERNEFNLNLPRYIDSQTSEDVQDIAGHLQGGIPGADVEALRKYWDVCPSLKGSLFRALRPNYFALSVPLSELKATIYAHPEFVAFIADMNKHFNKWKKKSAASLMDLKAGCHPKSIISDLAEDLLTHYKKVESGKFKVESETLNSPLSLLNSYDIYQHLMDYWAQTMQDDCYLIASDGFKAETYRIIETDKKGKEKDKGWTCDLIPKYMIVARYYIKEQTEIDALTAELEAVTARLAELEEEHGGDEGAFAELEKVNKANVSARVKELKVEGQTSNVESGEELAALEEWLRLNIEEGELKKKLKDAEADLDAKAYVHYPKLTEAEIKTLVVNDKWLAALDAVVHGEMDRVSQSLTQRVKELSERYETPLPQLTERVTELENKVNHHLERMGFAWK